VGLLPDLRRRVEAAADPFETAVRLAVAGNIIDFGLTSALDEASVHQSIKEALERPLAVDHVAELKAAVGRAKAILYVADNAGEIAFDRLLIERLPLDRTTLAVRGAPIINDATRADAEAVGLTDLVTVIDNGDDAPGTILESCSAAFRCTFAAADVILAKGQGNYETLSDAGKDVYFLLKAKCAVIARDVGCEPGGMCVMSRRLTSLAGA